MSGDRVTRAVGLRQVLGPVFERALVPVIVVERDGRLASANDISTERSTPPSISARFGLSKVFHTYSAYSRGFDGLWTMWQWLDRAPLGRNEGDMSWFHRHDEYPAIPGGSS